MVYAPMSADVVHSCASAIILSHGAQYGEVVVGLLSDAAIAAKRVPDMNYQERFQVVSNLKEICY